MKNKILSSLICSLLITNLLLAQGGRIDSTFGANGFTTVNPEGFYLGSSSNCKTMALKKNGKILMAGLGNNGSNEVSYQTIVQLKPDGTLDNKFGINGSINYQPAQNGGFDFYGINSMVVQSDGKILVAAGYFFTNGNIEELAITRFNANGTLDGSFGTAGSIYTDYASLVYSPVYIALQSDGKIIAASSVYDNSVQPSIIVRRYYTDGTSDPNFGGLGVIYLHSYFTDWQMTVSQILVQPDDRIVICGSGNYIGAINNGFIAARLLNYGPPDPSFAMGGPAYAAFSPDDNAYCNSLAVRKNGNIVVFGSSYNTVSNSNKFGFITFNANGTLTKNFNGTGKFLVPGIMAEAPGKITLQHDGKIIASGYQYTYGTTHAALIRVKNNGTMDSSFGTDGVVTPDSGTVLLYNDVAVDKNDKIVAAGGGYLAGYFSMAAGRYSSTMSLNAVGSETVSNVAINTDATVAPSIYPNPVSSNTLLTYSVDRNETVSIFLYDINGRLVQTLLTNAGREKGLYKEQLNIESSLPAGNYMLVLQTSTKKMTMKMIKQ